MGDPLPDGFKLDVPHREDCWCANDDRDLTFIVHDGTIWDRDRIGRRNGSTAWHRFRCNDPSCPATMIIRWDTLSRFVTTGHSDE